MRVVDRSDKFVSLHLFDQNERHVGKVYFRACQVCRQAWIGKISIYHPYDRRGLGRLLLVRLRAAFPDHSWNTSVQMTNARPFWRKIALESGQPYAAMPGTCEHATSSIIGPGLEGTVRVPLPTAARKR